MIQKIKANKKWSVFFTLVICGVFFAIYAIVAKQKSTTGPRTPYFVSVPIIRCVSGMPCVEIGVENKTMEVGIDLGYIGQVSLPGEFIHELEEKKFIKNDTTWGYRGKTYPTKVHQIPKIKIGHMNFYLPEVKELNWEFEKDAYLIETKPSEVECVGRLGLELFYNVNLLLDCEHSLLVFCDSLETLKMKGYPVERFTEIPLFLERDWLEIEVSTDHGRLRCILDTGSTWNILNVDPENKELDPTVFEKYDTKQFKIANTEFGTTTFRKLKMAMAIDAIIGMEFLCDKITFIDFKKEKLYFYTFPEEEVKVVAE